MGLFSVHKSIFRLAKLFVLTAVLTMFALTLPAAAQRTDGAEGRDPDPIMFWDFEKTKNKTSIEDISGPADILEGNCKEAKGIKGTGLRLDGFTACLRRKAEDKKMPSDELTIEAWVALGNYPWNWCPIITTESNEAPLESSGYHAVVDRRLCPSIVGFTLLVSTGRIKTWLCI